MSNELVLNASLNYTKNNVNVTESITNLLVSIIGNGLNSLTAYNLTTSDTAIPLGSSTTPRWLFILNTDPTNYITIKTAIGATLIARLQPGEFALLPLDPSITVPSFQAHTASCIVKFCLFDT